MSQRPPRSTSTSTSKNSQDKFLRHLRSCGHMDPRAFNTKVMQERMDMINNLDMQIKRKRSMLVESVEDPTPGINNTIITLKLKGGDYEVGDIIVNINSKEYQLVAYSDPYYDNNFLTTITKVSNPIEYYQDFKLLNSNNPSLFYPHYLLLKDSKFLIIGSLYLGNKSLYC